MKKTGGSLLLLLTALIWGTAFVAQRTGMDFVGPVTFQSARSFLGCLSLLPLVLYRRRHKCAVSRKAPSLLACVVCGGVLTVASTIQQIGLQYTTAGKAGFISSLYVILVPVIGLFLGRRAGGRVWLAVALSIVGLYLISVSSQFTLQRGDVMMLASALFFALHITVVDHFIPGVDGVMLSCAQFLVAGLLTLPFALALERPTFSMLMDAKWAILYTGVFSSGVAYTLQIIGQQRTPPAIASLTMSLESVFSALAGALLLSETLTGREMAGCALMLLAVVLSQLPLRIWRQPGPM